MAGGYALRTATDRDPLHPSTAGIGLQDGDVVPPGGTYAFALTLIGPSTPGRYTTRWAMHRGGAVAFGETVAREIPVQCDADASDPLYRWP